MNQETERNVAPAITRPAVHAGVEHAPRPHTVERREASSATPVNVVAQPSAPVDAPVNPTPETGNKELVLSQHVVSRSDLSKSLRELESIDDFFHQAAIRGSKDQTMPTLGKVLDSLAQANGLNMLKAEDRAVLKSFLTRLKGKAPVINMSFPSEASGPFLAKILTWFRAEVHPHTLMTVGLQPGLVAGCTLRTTNKTFDFSFRKKFEASKEMLIKNIQSGAEVVAEDIAGSTTPQDGVTPQESGVSGVDPEADVPKLETNIASPEQGVSS